jgi:hypothetical protein
MATSAVPQRQQLGQQRAARLHRVERVTQMGDLVLQQLAGARLGDHFGVVVLVLVGAVGCAVGGGPRVGPQPGRRPRQAAEEQRQQAQHLDRLWSAGGGAVVRSVGLR